MNIKRGCASEAIINIVRNIRNEPKPTTFHTSLSEGNQLLFFAALISIWILFKKFVNRIYRSILCLPFRSINQRFNYCTARETSTYVSITLVIPLALPDRSDGSRHELRSKSNSNHFFLLLSDDVCRNQFFILQIFTQPRPQ